MSRTQRSCLCLSAIIIFSVLVLWVVIVFSPLDDWLGERLVEFLLTSGWLEHYP
jgi:hypothetical protein